VSVTQCELVAVERLLTATLARCHSLAAEDRNAYLSAAGALRLMRVVKAEEATHGYLADLLLQPFQGAFEPFVR